MSGSIFDRELGQFPLSIGTSLAIEGACGIYPEKEVPTPPIQQFNSFWINVKTLFRNLYGSCTSEYRLHPNPNEMADVLLQEMKHLENIPQQYTNKPIEVVFYLSDYAKIERKYPFALPRMDNTNHQKQYTQLMIKTIERLIKLLKNLKENNQAFPDIQFFELKIKPKDRKKTLILTNYPFDLTSYKDFGPMGLLESHTGAIKEYAQWYTKYFNGKELFRFPFNEGFLQIFGDSELFRPLNIKYRKELMEIAEKYKWTSVSTRDKLMYGIDQIKNPLMKAQLREIL